MSKFNSLKKNREFKNVYNLKNYVSDENFILYIKKNDFDNSRIGISISKKVGNSVVRHKYIRKIREIFRLNQKIIKNNYDIVINCKKNITNSTYEDLNKSFLKLCKKKEILMEQ